MPDTGRPAERIRESEGGPESLQHSPVWRPASNQIVLTLSFSLMSHVREVAYQEGVSAEDILVELVSEGVAKRVFHEQQRPAPSHFMTRTGYVPPEANGNVFAQPVLSHHTSHGQRRHSPPRTVRAPAGPQASCGSGRRPQNEKKDE